MAATTSTSPLAGTTVAVTGATGFIGRHLVVELLTRGARVRAIQRPDSRGLLPEGVEGVRAPLSLEALRLAFEDVPLVAHLAGVVATPRPRAYGDVNVEGARAVAEAAQAVGAHLVHVSSLAAAGPAPVHAPRCEADPVAPLTPYGLSKLQGEQAIQAVTDAWTMLRPGAVYGPGDRAMLPVFQLARQRLVPFVGAADTAFTFVHVRDVVAALVAALERRLAGDTLFVGHPEPVGARQLVDEVAAVIGGHPRYVQVPAAIAGIGAHVGELVGRLRGEVLPLNRSRFAEMTSVGFVCRVDRLRDRLGVVAAVGLRAGLEETAAWYVREGWIPPFARR